MVPTFVVIGAAKCGTTSVCDILAGHPEVFVTDPKEPHFFSCKTDEEYHRLRPWYESLFDGARNSRAWGEGSTSFTNPNRISHAARRLAKAAPECHLVYMVRHPVRRLESDWRMRSLYGRVSVPISEAVREHPSLITYGLYWKHLSVYRRLFADEQILVVFLEDLSRDPGRELQRIFGHIGVRTDYLPPDAAQPRMAAKDFRSYGPVAKLIMRMPGFRQVMDSLPDGLVQLGKSVTTKPVHFAVSWEPASLRSVTEAFREDAAALLEHCGKPQDFWNLSAPPPASSGTADRV